MIRHEMKQPCPECGSDMQPISVFTKTFPNSALHYAPRDQCDTACSMQKPAQGIVRAEMCPACGRIAFYCVPYHLLKTLDQSESAGQSVQTVDQRRPENAHW